METHDYISIETICKQHQVPDSFIFSLSEFDLIEITVINENKYIPQSELGELERFVRLHRDLEINSEAIDIVDHLVKRIKSMQQEMDLLRKRLELYEPGN